MDLRIIFLHLGGIFYGKSKIICRTLVLGLCSFLSQISLAAAMAAINNMIRKYGAMDAVFGQREYAQIPMAVTIVAPPEVRPPSKNGHKKASKNEMNRSISLIY